MVVAKQINAQCPYIIHSSQATIRTIWGLIISVMWIWIRIHLGPWIQRYKMEGRAEFDQQSFWGFFFVGYYIFQV